MKISEIITFLNSLERSNKDILDVNRIQCDGGHLIVNCESETLGLVEWDCSFEESLK